MGFLKLIDRVALKIHVISRKTNPSCSVIDSQLHVWRVSEVCGGELGCGGKPCGVTDGKGRGCSWQVLRVCGCPCGGREEGKCLARALGKGAQEVALGQLLPDSDHLSFLLCRPFPGASAAVSLAERESGVLQYRSALWWWVHTCTSLTGTCLAHISFPAPLSWLRLFWLGTNPVWS